MEHFELDITDNLVTEIAPISPNGGGSQRRQHPPDHEWWYIFALQFLLWWSLWAIVDSIPGLLGYASLSRVAELKVYLAYASIGGIIYMLPLPSRLSEPTVKLKRFIGLVVTCCGMWGALDSSTDILEMYLKIPALYTQFSVLTVAGILGAIHHYKFREGYLIDHLA
jgi:hypothetical protein